MSSRLVSLVQLFILHVFICYYSYSNSRKGEESNGNQNGKTPRPTYQGGNGVHQGK